MHSKQAIDELEKAVSEAATRVREYLDQGVHPEAVALGLSGVMDGLPKETQTAFLNAMMDVLTDEQLEQFIKLQRDKRRAAGGNAPNPSTKPTS